MKEAFCNIALLWSQTQRHLALKKITTEASSNGDKN